MAIKRDWSGDLAARIGPNIAARRRELSLTTAALAERTSELGLALNKTVISRIETGHRHTLTVGELSVLAYALDTSPTELMYPLTTADPVEITPDRALPPWDAIRWFTGADSPVMRLHRRHERLLTELAVTHTRRANLLAAANDPNRRHPAEHDAPHREWADAETGRLHQVEQLIARVRRDITAHGATPPELPTEWRHIDSTDYTTLNTPYLYGDAE